MKQMSKGTPTYVESLPKKSSEKITAVRDDEKGSSEIERELNALERQIGQLGAALTQIEASLVPILRPANDADDPIPEKNILKDVPPCINTPLGNSIYKMSEAVKTLWHHVTSIHERIAL